MGMGGAANEINENFGNKKLSLGYNLAVSTHRMSSVARYLDVLYHATGSKALKLK